MLLCFCLDLGNPSASASTAQTWSQFKRSRQHWANVNYRKE